MTKAVGRSPVNPRARDPRETDGVLPNWADPPVTMVFFGLGFAYLWLWVKPALIASCGTVTNFPVFYKGWPFFFETVRTPGGFLQYVSAFASQMFYFSWAGRCGHHAARLDAVRLHRLSASKGGPARPRLLRFVPTFSMLVAYARYSYHLPLFVKRVGVRGVRESVRTVGRKGPVALWASSLVSSAFCIWQRSGGIAVRGTALRTSFEIDAGVEPDCMCSSRPSCRTSWVCWSFVSVSTTPIRSCCLCPGGSWAGPRQTMIVAAYVACICFRSQASWPRGVGPREEPAGGASFCQGDSCLGPRHAGIVQHRRGGCMALARHRPTGLVECIAHACRRQWPEGPRCGVSLPR